MQQLIKIKLFTVLCGVRVPLLRLVRFDNEHPNISTWLNVNARLYTCIVLILQNQNRSRPYKHLRNVQTAIAIKIEEHLAFDFLQDVFFFLEIFN